MDTTSTSRTIWPAPETRRILLTLMGLPLILGGVPASAQDLGDVEIAPQQAISVNSVTDGLQRDPDMDLAPNDDMVIVWDQDGTTIAARRLASDGSLAPVEDFVVNTNTVLLKGEPAVCVDAAGNSVIVWEERDADGSFDRNIRYRRFDSNFAPLTDEGLASVFATGSQVQPDVACAANGDFTVVWGGESADDPDGVAGRLFASDGSPIGDDFQISTEPDLFSSYPGVQVASQDDGDFVVVWSEAQNLDRALVARRFSSDGVALDASAFDVTSGDFVSRLALDRDRSSGDFVVAWNDSSNFGQDIKAQRYDSAGVPMGSTVFADVSNTASHPTSVAFSGPNGEVVVAFNPNDSNPARAQRFDAAMQPVGPEFLVGDGDGTFTSADAFVLQGKTNGELAVAYPKNVPDQSRDVFARRFVQALFADGFESGDTSEWSDLVQE